MFWVANVFMWICNKNNQLINVEKINSFTILKGKNYYDDNAVIQTYYYICADGNKIIKTASKDDVFNEFDNIKSLIASGESLYIANGLVMTEDEHGNLID